MERDADIRHYLMVIKRRKFQIIISALLVFGISAAIVFMLPSIYKSSGTILIETQGIPENIVQSTVTGYVEDRIQMITRLILSRARLLELIKRYDLYPDLKDINGTEETIQKMRKDIVMESIRSEDRRGSGTIAFTLSYEGKDPRKVAQVTNDIVSAYLKENKKNREQKAQGTLEFLELQLEELRSEILHSEKQIAEFKNKHITQLPELMQFNLQSMDRLDGEIGSIEEQVKSLINRKIYLQGQLDTVQPMLYSASADGNRIITPRTEAVTLRTQYLSLSTTHSKNHPDVIVLKKRLDAMEAEVNSRDEDREFYRRMEEKEIQLAQLSKKFSDKHPDVIKLQKEIDRLKIEFENLSEKQSKQKMKQEIPDNPLYINLQTQIEATQMEIDTAQKELKSLKSKYKDYQKRVESSPQVELEYQAIHRDYTNAQEKYQETRNRLLEAREAKGLEESRWAAKLTLLETPVICQKPYKPERLKILVLALVLALGVGVTVAFMLENMDQSVRRADDLAIITGKMVLGVIPYIETPQELVWQQRRKWIFLISSAAGVIILLTALNFLYKPLNILWINIIQKSKLVF